MLTINQVTLTASPVLNEPTLLSPSSCNLAYVKDILNALLERKVIVVGLGHTDTQGGGDLFLSSAVERGVHTCLNDLTRVS